MHYNRHRRMRCRGRSCFRGNTPVSGSRGWTMAALSRRTGGTRSHKVDAVTRPFDRRSSTADKAGRGPSRRAHWSIGVRPATWQAQRGATSTRSAPRPCFEHENDLYHCNLDGPAPVRLTHTPGAKELAAFSPDGKFVAFIRDNNLFVVDIATQTEPP